MRCLPPNIEDANLILGMETSDDAGVYHLNNGQAIVDESKKVSPEKLRFPVVHGKIPTGTGKVAGG